MPSPYDVRYVGRDVSILTFGTRDVIDRFRNANLNITFRFANVTAVMDSGERSRPIKYSFTVDFEELIDASSDSALETYVNNNAGEVTFTMKRADTGDEIEGNVLISSYSAGLADDAQVERMTFQGTGDLTVNGDPWILLPQVV